LTSSLFANRVGAAPTDDVIEITAFGPGLGESIVLHLPGFGWGVIDSCVFRGVCLPLDYLRALNVSLLNFVFLSHPHQDHYLGMDELLDAFPSIEMVGRYHGNSIEELKRFWLRQDVANGTEVSESLAKVFNALKRAADRGASYQKLSENVTFQKQGIAAGGSFASKIVALSPSAMSEEVYTETLQRCIPRVGKRMKPLKITDRNLIASAPWISVNDTTILLGSDVEKGTLRQTGWKGIVSSPHCPDLKIGIIKVAHHGSSGAHHQEAWSKHRQKNPISLVTPFVQGKHALPGIGDMRRIKEHSQKVGITGETTCYDDPSKHYTHSVLRQAVYDFRNWRVVRIPKEVGFLRLRYDLTGNLLESLAVSPAQLIS
jgi:hypothetical protein